jgi:Zn-dependent M28 family amino/carboxypeptidase
VEDYCVRPLIVCLFLSALAAPAQNLPQLTALLRPNDLKADVSFLASDGLKGRATPSPGLDAAAEYIASEFRRAGLDPAGDNGYFQTAPYVNVTPVVEGTSVPGELRNVIGVLRGSDPVLRDTYILVTAHYDHLGAADPCRPVGDDRICNGANDDASGTASVIEIAKALSSLASRPKRSIVFMTFFGEEIGLVGSRYYATHPVFPLSKTMADLNLEQLGRTDVDGGSSVGIVNVTGYDYSTLTGFIRRAGEATGVKVPKDERRNIRYFALSDNRALADAGVPAHTLSVGYDFPDYHRPGDKWPKLDYENLANLDRTIALAVFEVADSLKAPEWNKDIPATERYIKAREASIKNSSPSRDPDGQRE